MRRAVPLALAGLLCAGCAATRPFVATSGDFVDYRAFRLAATAGERLRAAQDYLTAHPDGAWALEVRDVFEREEPVYFENAKQTRRAASAYLTWLPRGPHAAAAHSLLLVFEERQEDEDTARMLRDARRTESLLALAAAQRKAVGEAVVEALTAFFAPAAEGAALLEAPSAVKRVLGSEASITWGTLPRQRDRELFYSVPTALERESRSVTLALRALLDAEDRLRGVEISGPNLFVSWSEADKMAPLDPTAPADRAEAARHVTELLEGFFEARMPATRCRGRGTGVELFVRRCDGWEVTAVMAEPPARGTSPGPDMIRLQTLL